MAWPELHAGTNYNYVWDTNTLDWVKETQPSGGGASSTVNIVDGTTAGQADVINSTPGGTEYGIVARTIGPLTDTELRASAVVVDGSGVTQPIAGTMVTF